MKKNPKIIGIIQAKNEWPILALSITHALTYHVDEVFVLNQGSTDGSQEKLKDILAVWLDRIHFFNCYESNFWQEASASTLVEICQSASPDWIYFFDADEFLLTRQNKPLKEVLNDIDPKYSAIRYEIQNWVSNVDFDENQLDHYRHLIFRSIPNIFTTVSEETIIDEIENGNWNFYDLPFPSKVIFRNTENAWLAAGSHYLKNLTNDEVFYCYPNDICAAHLPFLSRSRLESRARHGQRLMQSGFPIAHGWQSQLVYKLEQRGLLDQFWESHSITNSDIDIPMENRFSGYVTNRPEQFGFPARRTCSRAAECICTYMSSEASVQQSEKPNCEGYINGRTKPSVVKDDTFIHAIEPTLLALIPKYSEINEQRNEGQNLALHNFDDTQIPFRVAMRLTRKFQLTADKYADKYNNYTAERDSLIAERDSLIAERNALINERDKIINSRSWRCARFLSKISRLL